MHSNTVALDSLPPILLTFSDLLLLFLFVLWSSQYPMYFWYFHSMTLKLPFCLLPNWGEKSYLPDPRGRRGTSVTAPAGRHSQTRTPRDPSLFLPLLLKFVLPWWAWSGADENTDGLNISCPRPSLEKPICTHLCIPLLLAWQFREGQEFHSRWDTSLGRAEYEHTETKFLLLKIPWQLLGHNFPQDGMDTTS